MKKCLNPFTALVRWVPVAEGKERVSYQKERWLKLEVMQTSVTKQ
jgi:hypothetical protein